MISDQGRPRGVWVPAAFFALGGLLEVVSAVYDAPQPLEFWPIWESLGRAILHLLLAAGLWSRLSVCRFIAMIYCVAMIATYAAALALAFSGAPVSYPASVVLQSLYQVPSCVLLFPYLRSEAAAALFDRSLLGR
jgi:hypothetical protein